MKRILSFILLALITVCIFGCSGQLLSKDKVNTVALERHFQEVSHIDCSKKVVKDGIETVSPPSEWVTINPNDPNNIAGSNFKNTTTGSGSGLVVNHVHFLVDYADAALSMRVASGINTIQYTFYSCDKMNKDGNCVSAKTVKEQGTVTLDVSYTEKHLTGVKTMDDCTPPPATTPAPTNSTVLK